MDATRAQQILKNELKTASPSQDGLRDQFAKLSATEIADLFTSTSFFRSSLQPLIDQDWLRHQSRDPLTFDPRAIQLRNELSGLTFVEDEILQASSKQLKTYFNRSTRLLHLLIGYIQAGDNEKLRTILHQAMIEIDKIVRAQDRFPHNNFTEAMYRAFDFLDDLLGIEYGLDLDMANDTSRERLYEGAGIGVQTSYSSILLALDRAVLPQNARVIDLGSGYGRVGFALGLLRPDIVFTGYEFVEHRVKNSNDVSAKAGLPRVTFVTQDLSDFELPIADVYYMYDPFSRDTYASVMNQLIAIGRNHPVTIITKGRANTWVSEALTEHDWSMDNTCDSGTVSLFRSGTLP